MSAGCSPTSTTGEEGVTLNNLYALIYKNVLLVLYFQSKVLTCMVKIEV